MKNQFFRGFLRDLFSFWIMVTVSLCLGLVWNQFREDPLPLLYRSPSEALRLSVAQMKPQAIDLPKPNSAPTVLTFKEFRAFVEQKRGLVLDARPEVFYDMGHVPGALSLPRESFQSGYAKLASRLEVDRNQLLAVYCSGISCEDSTLVQQALISLGYSNVAVYRGGWEEWSAAGLSIEKE